MQCRIMLVFTSLCMCIQLYADDAMTYTLSAVTFRMSMTSHCPEVIAVAVPCMMSQNIMCVVGNMLQKHIGYCAICVIVCKSKKNIWICRCDIGLPTKMNHSTYPDHMMDVLVPFSVAHQQVVAVLVCGKHWFWWRELGRTSILCYILGFSD